MNEQIKTIIDRARELLAAATPGPVTAYPHPRPRQDHDESRFQWGDLVTGGRSMWTMIPMADAEALAFAVNNIRTLCDAVVDAERRVAEAEARDAHNRSEVERVIGPTLAAMKRAGIDSLPDATDELLRRLDTAEARIAELDTLHRVAEAREHRLERELLAVWATVRPGNPAPLTERDVLHAVEDVRRERDALRAAIVEAFEAFNHYSAPHGIQCPAYDDGAEAECDCWLSNTIGPLRSALRGQKLGAPAGEPGE